MKRKQVRYFAKILRHTENGSEIVDQQQLFYPNSDRVAREIAKKLSLELPRRCWQKGEAKIVAIIKITTVETLTVLPFDD